MIKNNLPELMARHRINMRQFSELTGIRPGTVSDLWHGKAKTISFDVFSKICQVLSCTPAELFAYEQDKPPEPPKKKRGRKPKVKNNNELNEPDKPKNDEVSESQEPPKKKRGRKPKKPHNNDSENNERGSTGEQQKKSTESLTDAYPGQILLNDIEP